MKQRSLLREQHWQRLRWQLFWGLVAALAPLPVRAIIVGTPVVAAGLVESANAFWGAAIAILLGILLIRNVGRYPGVERAAAIIPGFSVSFGLLVAVFLMVRLDYSRWGLAGSYFSVILIFYVGYSQVFGRKKLRIGILPLGGEIPLLTKIEGIDWVLLDNPEVSVEGVQAIAVDLRVDLPDEWDKLIADFALSDIPVYHSKHLAESLTGRVELEHLSETNYGTLSPPESYMLPKHLFDRLSALLSLLILAPLLIMVAILIRMDSPGPAIFQQTRIGFRGKPFTVYKFRTMRMRVIDETAQRDDAITRENDVRITGLGRILRRSRIDELPQIINILMGEMSWIGPRPEAAVLSEWYEAEIPFYRYRHIVRPGVTGWAQVMQGHVADVGGVRSKLHYDFYYIKNFSLWIDVLIMFKTFNTIISGFGSK